MLKEDSEGIYSFGKDGPDTVDSGFSVDILTLQLISMFFFISGNILWAYFYIFVL